MSADEVVHN